MTILPSKEQIDLFGEATTRRNKADKVRGTILPMLKVTYGETGNCYWEGDTYIVRAIESNKRILDMSRLISVLTSHNVKSPVTLIDMCHVEQTYPTFRVQLVPTL